MPQRRSAIKELRKNHSNRMHNLDIKTDLKKTVKQYVKTLAEKPEEAGEQLKKVYKKLDKAAKRNIIHKNTAARKKSRLSKMAAASKQTA